MDNLKNKSKRRIAIKNRSLHILCVCLIALILASVPLTAERDTTVGLSEIAVKIREEVDIGRMRKDISRLSSLESRVTGYPEAAAASKYVFDRFVETGLQNVESREFRIAVPVDHGDGRLEVLSPNDEVLRTIKIWPVWPNLVRTSLLPTGIKHLVQDGETVESIAKSYQVDPRSILEDSHNQYLQDQAADGQDNDGDGEIDEPGEVALTTNNTVFVPTGGLRAPLFYGGDANLEDFNGKDIGGFWYPVQRGDTLEDIAHRNRVTVGSITDDVLNSHLQKTEDGIDNNEDGEIDEYGEIPLLADIVYWDSDGIDNDADGYVDETPGDDRDGVDNNNDGLIDEEGEFVAASESSLFIPRGSVMLIDFNSSTQWINAAMLGAKAVVFIEPETTIRGEAENKFLTVPANIPRFWISRTDADQLLELLDTAGSDNAIPEFDPQPLMVRLNSTMTWERQIGQNIRGFLEGSDPILKDEMVVVTAYYDSMSVVPSLAPGADPTSGIAALLEVARILSKEEYRPGRSMLFVATDGHFQGLAGMRFFMFGIGQDIIARADFNINSGEAPGIPTMGGMAKGLGLDLRPFKELSRKLLLSIDRSVLVDLPPEFFYEIHQLDDAILSLKSTVSDVGKTYNQINSLRNKQRDFKEKQKRRRRVVKKREKQGYTQEERSTLETNLAKFKKDALQTTQFLRVVVNRMHTLQRMALSACREAQLELIENVALPMARLDAWVLEQLEADLNAGRVGGSYGRQPDDSYLIPEKGEDGSYYLPIPPTVASGQWPVTSKTDAISAVSDQWLVTRKGDRVAKYDDVKELSGLGSLEEINRAGREGLSNLFPISGGGEIRDNQPSATVSGVRPSEYRGGIRTSRDTGVSPVSGDSERFTSRDGNLSDSGAATGNSQSGTSQPSTGTYERHWTDAQRTQTLVAIQNLISSDFPLALTTDHKPLTTDHKSLVADLELLSNYLADWEFSDSRKFALQYAQERVLDRHLDFHGLKAMKDARKVVDRARQANRSLEDYIVQENLQLENALQRIPSDADFESPIKTSISRLRTQRDYMPDDVEETFGPFLSRAILGRLKGIQTQLRQKVANVHETAGGGVIKESHAVLIEELTKDKQGIFEIAMRNARLERKRLESLLDGDWHASLNRPYFEEEILVLRHYLESDELETAIEARDQIVAHLEERRLLRFVKQKAREDIVELQNLWNGLDNFDRDFPDDIKILLRDNMLTLRNSRIRNIQSRVAILARFSKSEYDRNIAAVEQAISLQDLFNRYYTSLFVSVDLSTQSDKFAVFNKGWFYDQQPEFVLRREFAPIGNKLMQYANDVDFGVRIGKLWSFTDDQIRQAVMNSQWEAAFEIETKKEIEGKSLETLISDHYESLVALTDVSRLMKMQFEQMQTRGEPSEEMLKDMDYIRNEVERFIQDDLREAQRTRKNTIRLLNRLPMMLALRHEDSSQLSSDEIEDIQTLIDIVGLGGETNFVNAIGATGAKTWRTYIPGKIAFDSEVATLIGKTGVTFATIDDGRLLTDTPLDTIDRMDLSYGGNLHKQVKTLTGILIQAMLDPKMPTGAKVSNFYCNLFGDVVEYDARESALPNTPVPYPIVAIRRKHKTMMGVRGDLIAMGNNKAQFDVPGLAMEGRATHRIGGLQEVDAYLLDSDSGDIVYAPDLGNFGAKLTSNKLPIQNRRRGCRVIVFPCVSTTIYDLVDQRYLRTLRELQVFDGLSDSPPEKYGMSKPWQQQGVSATEPIALVYSEPDSRIKIGMAYGQIGKRLLLIKAGKSGAKNPALYTGSGFVVRENGSIRVTPYVVVRDMWWLDENRTSLYKRFGISSDRLDQLHFYAHEHLDQAETALSKKEYSTAMKLARAAWGYESRAYPDVKKTGNDVVNGVMFYLALLLPFSYFMERLIFASPDVHKRIGGAAAIFILVFFFLAQVHPAFQITTTPVIILVAFVVLVLTVFVIAIILRKFEEQLEKIRQESSKVYKADVGRLAASAAAFSLGVSNMRKRKGRTILTCATLVILTFTVISFTSVRTFMHPNKTNLPAVTPRYTGMLIRDQYWRPLEAPVISSIMNDLRKTQLPEPDFRMMLKRRGTSAAEIEDSIAQLSEAGALASVSAEPTFLFSMDSELQEALAQGDISTSLNHEFDRRGILLTPQSEIQPVTNEDRWEITGNRTTYTVRKDGDELKVYQPSSMLTVHNAVGPRAWYQSSGTGDQSFIELRRSSNAKDPVPPEDALTGQPYTFSANMLVGMSAAEPRITGINRYLYYGKWFDPADEDEWPTRWPYACVLPKGVADLLGIVEADMGKATVSVYGADFTVTGVLGIGFKDLTDNDGEELTPIDHQLMKQQSSRGAQGNQSSTSELQKYIHLTPDSIAILPYQVIINQGGTLRSVAVNMEPQPEDPPIPGAVDKLDLIMAPLMSRIALDFFVARDKNTYLYSSIGMTSFSGMGNLFIPILIASLIVLNTMLGAVYERIREISIYSSVGLAPVHIAFLFLAEACVYAIVGAVLGYLLGQVVATLLVNFGWLSGLTLNYSSMSTVVATIIVMIVVVGSTLYPAIKASRMAVPDLERKWKLPEPTGDEWHFNLPFTVLSEEALGLNIFMRDYFDAHADESASDFYTNQVEFSRFTEDSEESGQESYAVSMMVWLAPYDLGVSQGIRFVTTPVGGEEEELYQIKLDITRESGEIASWKRVNRRFLNLIRKQLLIWRTLSPDVRGEFHDRGRQEDDASEETASPELAPQPAD